MRDNTHDLIQKEGVVFILVDIQEKLVPIMTNKEMMVANAARLIQYADILNIPLIVTEQQKLGATIPELANHFSKIEPITKITFNCFGEPEFVQKLNALNPSTLVIWGIEAQICVAQTAIYALGHYKVHVVADAVASRFPHNYRIGLDRMAAAGATITSTEMVMYEILQKAGDDTFREVLKLVK